MNVLVGSLLNAITELPSRSFLRVRGRVTRFDGQIIECDGFPVSVGAICAVRAEDGAQIEAEVIGFREGRNLLFLYEFGARIEVGAWVEAVDPGRLVEVGDNLLGRVIDAQVVQQLGSV